MFALPNTQVPQAVIDAANLLKSSNELFESIRTIQRSMFQSFWYEAGSLKSKERINETLAAMDAASPGQSIKFFASARELAELILSLSPDALGTDDWHPKYEYEVTPEGIRVK